MTIEIDPSAPQSASQQPPLGVVRAVALAVIGLIGLVGDEIETAYQRSVQREREHAPAGGHRSASISRLALDEWETTLTKLNLPTKSDIDALTQQMSALEEQIDQIAAQRAVHHSAE
jgi:hypothetical protein